MTTITAANGAAASTAPASPAPRPKRERNSVGRWVVWALLVAGALLMFFPVYWVFVTAISPGGLAQSGGFALWPSRVDLGVFARVFKSQPIGLWMLNSTITSVASVVISVVISLLAGYAFAKYRFRGRDAIFALMLLTIMVPIQVIVVPEFVIVSKLGLVNSYWSVILPSAAQGICIFIARQFLVALPDELIEAARVDGAGEFKIFRSVVLPMSGPLIAVLTILTFVWRWNDFIWPLIALQTPDKFTMSVGLNSLNGAYAHPWDQIMAVTLLSMIPVIVVFLVFQRQFVQGIAETGLK
ncbi:carbohydrate ABC transporter permease [Gryllotalpicola ginsengisoli]|uniref:carbohydrate ABC transporter permease n=1 Tax=Gryllotalpicola ginsengisoli TaxID=444608 RepID=UPI0009D6D7D2|nr:carbohydrate ABC transporter permease [Gryllotalpicola ginsengisoli]